MRHVPGLGLMCSKYFVCRGCGQAELRSLAVQPERDVQHARAPEVLKGQGLDEFMNGGGGGALSYGNWSRPTSATISATARLASPRLRVNAADGWHRAAMCKECAERMRREEQEEAERVERETRDRLGPLGFPAAATGPSPRAVRRVFLRPDPAKGKGKDVPP